MKVPKEMNVSNVYTILKPKNQECIRIYPSSENGFILLYTTESGSPKGWNDLVIARYNSKGVFEWDSVLPETGSNIFCSLSTDGGALIASGNESKFIKINKEGRVDFNTTFNNSDYNIYSYPYDKGNGQYFINTNPIVTWQGNAGITVYTFDANGNVQTFLTRDIGSPWLGANYIAQATLYQHRDPFEFNFFGLKQYTLDVNPQLFAARVEFAGVNFKSNKVVALDTNIHIRLNKTDYIHLFTPDKQLLILVAQKTPNQKTIGHLTRMGENLVKIWDKDLVLGLGNSIPKFISLCPDNNFLIGGYCNLDGNALNQPYAMKVDINGNILWKKTYTTSLNAMVNSGFQAADGTIYLAGTTNGFGEGKTNNDILILKTVALGNIQ